MTDRMRTAYREEANELLQQLETTLLTLETSPQDMELIGTVFRQMHTIKGSGAMFGFDRIAAFTHQVETAFDLVRAGTVPVTHPLITLTLEARDHIKAMLDADFGGAPADDARGEVILAGFRELIGDKGKETAPQQRPTQQMSPPTGSVQTRTFRIRFRPSPDIFLNGTDPVLLLRELGSLGTCTITAQTQAIPNLEAFDPDKCYVFWDILLTTAADENAIRDVFLFVEDASELKIEALELDAEAGRPKVGEILVEKGDVAPADLENVLKRQKRIGEILIAERKTHPDSVRSALAEQEHIARQQEDRGKTDSTASIRVAAGKLDSLVNTVGELVTTQARLSRLATSLADPELGFVAEEMERLIDRLRADTMSVRMLPIGATFARFGRLVRDLSRNLGKQIELATEGAETELDKTVIEQLNDPLVHIIRNCVDHGIELPQVRIAAGKPAHGTIRLSAVHSGAHVLIRVSDDGAGLDQAAILAKAVERGLVPAGTELPETEVFKLVFQPGFSTAKAVTEISGRGVGLDVVHRGISALRGSVEVRSRKGEGTTFTLKLPLTLAIIDGLLVSVGSEHFVMPVSNIVECVELTREEVRKNHGRKSVVVRDELIPYIGLREYFAIAGEAPQIAQVMLADTELGKFGFVVDRVIGDHQTVVKSLGRVYRGAESISGATILGDGAVALILDPEKLVREAVQDAGASHPHV